MNFSGGIWKLTALGGIQTHDTLHSKQSALPAELLTIRGAANMRA